MEEKNDIGVEELLEYAKLNNMTMSYSKAKDLVEDGNLQNNIEDVVREDETNPIAEYENLAKKMRKKISEIVESIKEDEKEKSDDRDEKDNLDEKDGKEELDEDKKEEVEEREKENKDREEPEDKEPEDNEKDEEIDDNHKENDKKQEETPKKDEYLAKVKKLHKMKLVDYKDQMKHDDPRKDKYFMTMIYLQKEVNRQRDAFVKEYGNEELKAIENADLKEELKYENTLNARMEKDLTKLRQLDEKLDSILDRMQTLQKSLQDKSISLEEYNDEINSLEKDKLDTLWEINKLNPELLEEKQENMKDRDEFERRESPINTNKVKDITEENRKKEVAIEHSEKKQEGMSEKYNDEIKENMQKDIDEKGKRLDELRKELKNVDVRTPEGKKKTSEIIDEIEILASQKMSEELQKENIEKNMSSGVQNYSDLESSEVKREEYARDTQETSHKRNPEEMSDELAEQWRNSAIQDPDTPEQAADYINNMEEIEKQALEEKNKEDKEESKESEYVRTLNNKK